MATDTSDSIPQIGFPFRVTEIQASCA